MHFGRFFWKLFLGNAVLLAVIFLPCAWLIARGFQQFYAQDLVRQLETHANYFKFLANEGFQAQSSDELDALAKRLSTGTEDALRVTFISITGEVLGDSHAVCEEMDSHRNRPEVLQSLVQGQGVSSRWSNTLSRRMTYLVVPVKNNDQTLGFVRVAMSSHAIGERTQSTRNLIWTSALTALGSALLLTFGLARLWSSRIARITDAARNLSQGDLNATIDVGGNDETALLARSINRMKRHIVHHLETIDHQHRILESMVAQLGEGVILTDSDGQIVLINPEAAHLLQLKPSSNTGSLVGMPAESVIKTNELRKMLRDVNGTNTIAHQDVPLPSSSSPSSTNSNTQEQRLHIDGPKGPITILARACPIVLPASKQKGANTAASATKQGRLLVLTNVSELAKTIQVKADFAANASHELRTPVAAILAAVETLRSIDWNQDAHNVNHFLDVIERQGSRMENMVTDLLNLSRLESPTQQFKSTWIQASEAFYDIHSLFNEALTTKRLHWSVDLDPNAEQISANPELLRIILRNLVDNAIRFTDAGGHIRVGTRREKERLIVFVCDNGCGIHYSEQQRVFERFYQVTRSRSGVERGTGLGLSIVRHAVAAMGGTVHLESEPGRGTQVMITMPDSLGGQEKTKRLPLPSLT